MKDTPNVRQTKIFRKMSLTRKIELLDQFFSLAKELNQNDDKTISHSNKLRFGQAQN